MRRDFGELHIPRVHAGPVSIPARHATGRVTVLVTLPQPPLAAYSDRTLAAAGARQKLNVKAAGSREYLATLARLQTRAAVELKRAIPQATVSRRLRIVLDALTVELPVKQLPELRRLSFVNKVYPSMRFTLNLDTSPGLIGATAFSRSTGDNGDGVKIAVVDDGIDQTSTFFDPTGYSYPAGFPRGQLSYTTPKVIVARSYPGPGAGKPGSLPLDRKESFHGTHVAGIAAGDAGTTAPAGRDHPEVKGLSGVAPRAWLGNYRVFNAPTPIGDSAFTPQIVAAFEDAVADGMDVINFSGGGPMNDPGNDALVEAVHNVAAAGVIPVISAGNDRDDFGLGSVGAPGTAPDAISVAAVSNAHVFGPTVTVSSPAGVGSIPFNPGASATPPAWGAADQTLVDVASITGSDGKPVDGALCGPPGNLESTTSTLPANSLAGAIALVSRGTCTFASKSARAKAAGAEGIVLVDNRPGEANGVPIRLSLPAGMIADTDGARLRSVLTTAGGKATVRVGLGPGEITTGRGGTSTSFSSAGLTPFGHDLKPDLAAPGGAILSSTVKETMGEPFAVFDGTSMAAPHVAGAAALLVQRHPQWSAAEVKSALMSTAGPAWGDTSRTSEASVLLEGAGLIDVGRADNPAIFSDPASLSFHYLNVNGGAVSKPLLTTILDAGNGYGTWEVSLHPQSATAGTMLDLPASVTVSPGGDALLTAVARASASAAAGDNYGFIVLRKDDVTRRIPYEFTVERPALESVAPVRLAATQSGDTRGTGKVSAYRWPAAPFGPPASYSGPPMNEDGAERLYVTELAQPAVNMGVAVLLQGAGTRIDPFFLGSRDENDVTGYTGTPVNVNGYLYGYRADVQAAGIQYPRQGQYYVAVDSGHDDFSGRPYAGQYLLHSWLNDVSPPLAAMTTLTVTAGRPTLVAQTVDSQSGVDPLSLTISYGRVAVGAAAYDPLSGIAIFPLPKAAPALKAGTRAVTLVSGDFQEDKNVDQAGEIASILPNTAFVPVKLKVVKRPTVTWLAPERRACTTARTRLLVVAGATKSVRNVRFLVDGKPVATVRRGTAGLYAATWTTKGASKGAHELEAVVTDAAGKTAEASRSVKVCGKSK